MTVSFTVPGRIVGKNAVYTRDHHLTKAAREYRRLISLCAIQTIKASDWPRDPLLPKHVRLTVRLFNTRHDSAAATHFIRDSLQGLAYDNDKVVVHGAEEIPIKDDGGTRAEVTLELLAVREAFEVMKLAQAAHKRAIAKFRAPKTPKKRAKVEH